MSVITPSYNHARYIRRTIESVLAQDYPRVEHIVVDGGSTDGTVAILREYGERYPGRFRWVSEPDRGQSHAFNKGLAMARGAFIGWQNSDDYYLPGAFREPLDYLARHPEVAAVYGDCADVDEQGNVQRVRRGEPFDFGRLLTLDYITNQSTFIRRDALLACAGLDLDLHYAMDHDLWLRLGLRFRLAYLPGVRGAFTMLPDAKTQSGRRRNLADNARLVERITHDPLFPAELLPKARQAAQEFAFDALLHALQAGDQALADQMLRQALERYAIHHYWDRFFDYLIWLSLQAGTARLTGMNLADRLLTVARASGTFPGAEMRQVMALAIMYRAACAFRGRAFKKALAYLVQVLAADASVWRRRRFQRAVLRIVLGDTIADTLRGCLSWLTPPSLAQRASVVDRCNR